MTSLLKFPFDLAACRSAQQSVANLLGASVFHESPTKIEFVLIPPGEFRCGLSPIQHEKIALEYPGFVFSSQIPQRLVCMERPYLMSIYPVTEKQYYELLGGEESSQLSVEICFWDAAIFCNTLSRLEGLPEYYTVVQSEDAPGLSVVRLNGGSGYRLPTEAEWEYACRAGTETLWYFGDIPQGSDVHIAERPLPNQVGILPPNPFGLYDMFGNGFQLCIDIFDDRVFQRMDEGIVNPVVLNVDNPYARRVAKGRLADGLCGWAADRVEAEPWDDSFVLRLVKDFPSEALIEFGFPCEDTVLDGESYTIY